MESNNYQLPANINSDELPNVVTRLLNGITKVEKAHKDAEDKAENAKRLAEIAKNKSAGWSFRGSEKKEAIEALQIANFENSDAHCKTIEAIKELLQNQKEMSQTINYLFGLSVVNIASNRIIVRELEMRLRNASKEELSDFARKEVESIIRQLRAQEDMQNRINGHDGLLLEHKSNIDKAQADINEICGSINEFKQSCQQAFDNAKQMYKSVEQLKSNVNESLYKLEENFSNIGYRMEKKIDDKATELEAQVNNRVSEEVSKSVVTIYHRIDELAKRIETLQEQINNKTFFDATLYKLIIGLIAILSLVIHFL